MKSVVLTQEKIFYLKERNAKVGARDPNKWEVLTYYFLIEHNLKFLEEDFMDETRFKYEVEENDESFVVTYLG